MEITNYNLEQMTDKPDGLADLLNRIAHICFEKQEHIEHSWQDRILAKKYNKIGIKLQNLISAHIIEEI